MEYGFLFDLSMILLFTKVFSLCTKKLHLPQVVGALMAGMILGPSVLNVIKETDFLKMLSELGVILIMFTAGLGTNVKELKKVGKAAFSIAMFGVLTPLFMGLAFMWIYRGGYSLEGLFLGIICTATSVTLTVETLKELNKQDTRVGRTILGAALIDDILGIIALSVGLGVKEGNVDVLSTILKIGGFFAVCLVAGVVFYKFFTYLIGKYKTDMRRFVILSFTFCLLLAFVAENYFGVSGIIGAYIAGAVLSNNPETKYVKRRFEIISYMLFTPVFFTSVGLEANVTGLSIKSLWFILAVVAIAMLSKLLGCGITAKVAKFSIKESAQIGVGMMARGEVALILAKKANQMGIISQETLTSIIVVVIVCAICTPIFLKFVFKDKKENASRELVEAEE